MTRKQLKSVVNQAAVHVGCQEAKATFGQRNSYIAVCGAFIHKPTAILFKA